jgi:circadian clock protein KaiC
VTSKRVRTRTSSGNVQKHPPRQKQPIPRLCSGVPGLDAILGGGYPDLSFNVIAGSPGAGKTTLALQTVFANATAERPGLYFTVLGEPTLKMIRYQQQFDYFDPARLGRDVHLLNLSGEAMTGDLDAVLARIMADVERLNAGMVVVDSFRSLGPGPGRDAADARDMTSLEHFVQRLALQLTSWQTTSFLISEYNDAEQRHPVFTVADGIVWLSQVPDRNSVVRKLQVLKVRGQGFMPGLHTLRITDAGVRVYPRIPEQQGARRPAAPRRLATGIRGLDDMLGGGIPAGDAVMLTGPTGAGKTTFVTQFVAEGARTGDATVVAVFEEYPERYLTHAKARGIDLQAMIDAGELRVIYLRPLDLSVDETLSEILEAVESIGAARVVIDSVSGFEIALAPAFREDFRESFYRLVGALTAVGVTVLMTNEVTGAGTSGEVNFTGERVSFLTDDIIILRHLELEGKLRTAIAVVKMRGGSHSDEFREYRVTADGAEVGASLEAYKDILTGFPERRVPGPMASRAGLTAAESTVLDALVSAGPTLARDLAPNVRLPVATVTRALTRLVSLDYVERVTKGNAAPRYRALAPGVGV